MPRCDSIVGFARDLYGHAWAHSVAIEPLCGGLETAGVSLVSAKRRDGRETASFVVKPMSGEALREYEVHAWISRQDCCVAAPKILGSVRDNGCLYVFLEYIPAMDLWPWRSPEYASMVLEQLARVHSADWKQAPDAFQEWNYDSDLSESAASTVELYGQLFASGFRVWERPMAKPLERIAESIVAIRRQVVEFTGKALLHGDVHPGNAVVRRIDGTEQAVLLDWGRARLGSPLEDVMSWLHSLGLWEPVARRVHDSLLARYNIARGSSDKLTSDFRAACWLAGACNAMAGALRYHLAVASDSGCDPQARADSSRAAADWLRIVRRADAIRRS